jgi:hypothetical protein
MAEPAVADQVILDQPVEEERCEDLMLLGLVWLLLREAEERGCTELVLLPKGGVAADWGHWVNVGGLWFHAGRRQIFSAAHARLNELVWVPLPDNPDARHIGRRRRRLKVWGAAMRLCEDGGPVEVLINADGVKAWLDGDVVTAVVFPGGALGFSDWQEEAYLRFCRRAAVAGAVEALHRAFVGSVAASQRDSVATSARLSLASFSPQVVEGLAHELAAAAALDPTALLILAELAWEHVQPLFAQAELAPPSPLFLPKFFVAPTSIFPVIGTMGSLKPVDRGDHVDLSGGPPLRLHRWEFANGVVVSVPVGDIPGVGWQETLGRLLDPLSLKVLYGCLFFCARRGEAEFYYSPHQMLELLGYHADLRGQHYFRNRQRIEERIDALSRLVFEFRFRREPYTVTVREPLIGVDWGATVEVAMGEKTVVRGTRVRVSKVLWRDVAEGKFFTWLDPRFLQIDPRAHPEALLLYPYYATAWRMDWQRARGRVRRRLRSILSACGIDAEPPAGSGRLGRKILRIEQEHDFLAGLGLIGGWDIVEFCPSDRAEEVWEVWPPEGWCQQVTPFRRLAEEGWSEGDPPGV